MAEAPIEISAIATQGSWVIATNASDTIRKAPVTELATTELTRLQPNHCGTGW